MGNNRRNRNKGIMANIERDRFLTEKIGECWHESSGMVWICGDCKADIGWRGDNKSSVDVESLNPDFSTWQGFGKLWEFAIKQEWWGSFVGSMIYSAYNVYREKVPDFDLINPD